MGVRLVLDSSHVRVENSSPITLHGHSSPSPQAKLVASATGNLCEAANSVVQGNAQEEKLIAAAKAVAASTAQLLIACQVKADPRSENNRRLQVWKHAYLWAGPE